MPDRQYGSGPPKAGFCGTRILLGDAVRQHDRVGVISDLFGDNEESLFSPVSGVVIGRLDIPLVHEGDAVFHIACFEEEKISEHLWTDTKKQPPESAEYDFRKNVRKRFI